MSAKKENSFMLVNSKNRVDAEEKISLLNVKPIDRVPNSAVNLFDHYEASTLERSDKSPSSFPIHKPSTEIERLEKSLKRIQNKNDSLYVAQKRELEFWTEIQNRYASMDSATVKTQEFALCVLGLLPEDQKKLNQLNAVTYKAATNITREGWTKLFGKKLSDFETLWILLAIAIFSGLIYFAY